MRKTLGVLMLSSLFMGSGVLTAGPGCGSSGAPAKEAKARFSDCCKKAITAVQKEPGTVSKACCGFYFASFKSESGKVKLAAFKEEKAARKFAATGDCGSAEHGDCGSGSCGS